MKTNRYTWYYCISIGGRNKKTTTHSHFILFRFGTKRIWLRMAHKLEWKLWSYPIDFPETNCCFTFDRVYELYLCWSKLIFVQEFDSIFIAIQFHSSYYAKERVSFAVRFICQKINDFIAKINRRKLDDE